MNTAGFIFAAILSALIMFGTVMAVATASTIPHPPSRLVEIL